MKSVIESNFISKKEEVIFLHFYHIIDIFLIMNYKSDIKVFHLYKFYINKQDFSTKILSIKMNRPLIRK